MCPPQCELHIRTEVVGSFWAFKFFIQHQTEKLVKQIKFRVLYDAVSNVLNFFYIWNLEASENKENEKNHLETKISLNILHKALFQPLPVGADVAYGN